jgi:hypothetical protein
MFLFSLFIPVYFSYAYIPNSTDLGGSSNPINIKIQPDYGAQKRQENLMKESQLKSTYGYSAYVSCKSSACGSYDATDPYAVSSCLSMVEAWFGFGRCGVQKEQIKKIISCGDGYTNVDGVCKSYNSICSGKWGNSKWNGEFNDKGGAVCDCQSGYVWNDQETACIIRTVNTIKSTTTTPKIENKAIIKETKISPTDFDVISEDIESFKAKGVLRIPAVFRKCPSKNCSVIRYYAETSELNIIGKYTKDDWYQIEGTTDVGGNKITGWINQDVFGNIFIEKDSNMVIEQNDQKIEVILPASKNTGFWSKIKRWFGF